jgi:hypothetical protein
MLNPDMPQYASDGRKFDNSSGEIFTSITEARDYALDAIECKLCTRFVIGVFMLDSNTRMIITSIETFGFKHDKKNVNQMKLF